MNLNMWLHNIEGHLKDFFHNNNNREKEKNEKDIKNLKNYLPELEFYKNIKIKNCPFCGGIVKEITSIEEKDENFTYLECSHCGTRTKPLPFSSKSDELFELIEIWNARILSEELFEKLSKENITLKFIIANTNLPCIYCGLPREKMNECKVEHDECGRLNDLKSKPNI